MLLLASLFSRLNECLQTGERTRGKLGSKRGGGVRRQHQLMDRHAPPPPARAPLSLTVHLPPRAPPGPAPSSHWQPCGKAEGREPSDWCRGWAHAWKRGRAGRQAAPHPPAARAPPHLLLLSAFALRKQQEVLLSPPRPLLTYDPLHVTAPPFASQRLSQLFSVVISASATNVPTSADVALCV